MALIPVEQAQQRIFERVVVARPHGFEPGGLLDRPRDRGERAPQPIVGVRRFGDRARRQDHSDQVVDRLITVEFLALPGRGEVPPFEQFARRRDQNRPRPFAIGQLAPAQHPPQRRTRSGERMLEPAVERGIEEPALDFVRRDLEHRVDARRDRPLAQQVGAEGMNRADVRLLEFLQRGFQTLPRGGVEVMLVVAGALDRGPQAQLEFAGRLFGEGHGDDPIERREPACDHRDDPADQRGGLAGARGRFDNQRGSEIVLNPITDPLIGGERLGEQDRRCRRCAHRISRRRVKSASRACTPAVSLLRRTRICSYGPQTMR